MCISERVCCCGDSSPLLRRALCPMLKCAVVLYSIVRALGVSHTAIPRKGNGVLWALTNGCVIMSRVGPWSLPLSFVWLNCLSSSSDATACRSAICSSLPGSISTSPAPLSTRGMFLSYARSVSATLSLCALILSFPVKVLSIIVLIRSRHWLLCGFVALPCDASAAQPSKRPRASMSADNTYTLLGSSCGDLFNTILGNGRGPTHA